MPLVLDLLRHGEAVPATNGGDGARRLTPRGEQDLERLGRHLADLGWHPNRVFTSPLIRAVDSARIVLAQAVPDLQPTVLDALEPDGDPDGVVRALIEGGHASGHLLLVAHQPLLGELARRLTGDGSPGLAPGDLVRVEIEDGLADGAGRLAWKLRPQDCA